MRKLNLDEYSEVLGGCNKCFVQAALASVLGAAVLFVADMSIKKKLLVGGAGVLGLAYLATSFDEESATLPEGHEGCSDPSHHH